jgi:hypothetical protein
MRLSVWKPNMKANQGWTMNRRLVSLMAYAKTIGAPALILPLDRQIAPVDLQRFGKYFQHPNPTLARVPSLRLRGDTFLPLTPDGCIVEDATLTAWAREAAETAEGRHFFSKGDERVFGPGTLVLGAQKNYYHWLLNWMSRIFIFQQAGLLDQFSNILVNEDLAPYQLATIAAVPGLSGKRLVGVSANEVVAVVDSWWASLISNPIHSIDHITWLRDLFGGDSSPIDASQIYISRRDAPGSRRQIKNAQEVEDFLHSRGFLSVQLTDYSLRQQAAIFSQARSVVAPHGAGLTNCIFLQPGARVCELQAEDHYTQVFYSLGVLSRVKRYDIIPCRSHGNELPYLRDIEVDVVRLGAVLDRWSKGKLT